MTTSKMRKYAKKMTIKVTERMLVIALIYAIFLLFDIKLTVGI